VNDPKQPSTWLSWVPLFVLFLSLVAVVVVYFVVPGDAMTHLKVITGYVTLMLLFFFGLMVLFAIARGTIDLSHLLSEAGGGASMSRFQLLIFTFVIAFSLFLIIVSSDPMKFPVIPAEILTLLGISASTYAVSKGIQASSPTLRKDDNGDSTVTVQKKTEVKEEEIAQGPTSSSSSSNG
jgi:hypothetical protein